MGHKRILLVTGESGRTGADYTTKAMQTIYATRAGRGEIRRVNVNMAPLPVEGFRALKEAGIGTYQCFQETYHPEQYRYLHPSGPKADYEWRVGVFDRCFAGGVDDVGMGVLFGLYDYRFEVLALLVRTRPISTPATASVRTPSPSRASSRPRTRPPPRTSPIRSRTTRPCCSWPCCGWPPPTPASS